MEDQLYNFDHCFVCDQTSTKHKTHKNGSACKFLMEAKAWKVSNENHSCLLLIKGKQCGNKICTQSNFV